MASSWPKLLISVILQGLFVRYCKAEQVSIFKIGFPEEDDCGQEKNVTKSNLNPHYFFPMHFGGFSEGLCSDVGYSVYKYSEEVTMHPVPFIHHNLTFQIWAKPRLAESREEGSCEVGSDSLCNCIELLETHQVSRLDDCTQSDAVSACKSGKCLHSKPRLVESREEGSCKVGSDSLCSCSELLKLHLISSLDDCTQSAAVSACSSGKCSHSDNLLVY
eukprot:TRINITY_DN6235_c0_g1_i1.p1 TRINITY_DN6235_c0_g1~~TRINITY_DN6235_c0_g1_i1.p1  ORF type:complete len:218 (-),score=37.86 TRINITY_DN6235_c0_g1_i1:51-704(-)